MLSRLAKDNERIAAQLREMKEELEKIAQVM